MNDNALSMPLSLSITELTTPIIFLKGLKPDCCQGLTRTSFFQSKSFVAFRKVSHWLHAYGVDLEPRYNPKNSRKTKKTKKKQNRGILRPE
jgi:hypothetical protein